MKQLGLFLVLVILSGNIFAQNSCGNNYKIFNVPKGKTPKPVTELGSLPEFPMLRHLSTADEVYRRIKTLDKAPKYSREINQLFAAMGYSGVNDPSFTQDDIEKSSLPFGAVGMMGDGNNNYSYTILTVSNRPTLDCWKIAAKEGTNCNVYFMADCGNAFYYTNPPAAAPVATVIQMPKREVSMKIKVYARYTPEVCNCCEAWGSDMVSAVNYEEKEEKVLLSEQKIDNIEVSDDNEVVVEKVYIDVDKKEFRKLKKHEPEINNDNVETTTREKHYTVK